jgi:DNA invertase Pin-like site-specific DNA recombinase
MKKAITYYRVSTPKQGISGLGLDAQRQAVQDFARINDFVLTSEFVEIESGKRNNRPVLLQALEACKKHHAILLIAKLDRLGGSVAFISMLMEAGVDFKAVDNPNAGKFIVHIMAAFAEHERDLISKRTIDALKVAKSKGVELGKHGRYVLSVVNKQQADNFALTVSPVVKKLQRRGITTVRAITRELNRLKIQTYHDTGRWHSSTVHKILQRINKHWSL